MIQKYCETCNRVTGHKRAMGIGTLLGTICTGGLLLAATPFYPKRCIVCGCETKDEWELDPNTGKYVKLTQEQAIEKHMKEAEEMFKWKK